MILINDWKPFSRHQPARISSA